MGKRQITADEWMAELDRLAKSIPPVGAPWADDELAMLRAGYGKVPRRVLAEFITAHSRGGTRRTVASIEKAATRMGLTCKR